MAYLNIYRSPATFIVSHFIIFNLYIGGYLFWLGEIIGCSVVYRFEYLELIINEN